MGDKKIYIVAKIFDQQGCLAYLCKTPNEARCLPGTLEALRADAATAPAAPAGVPLPGQ